MSFKRYAFETAGSVVLALAVFGCGKTDSRPISEVRLYSYETIQNKNDYLPGLPGYKVPELKRAENAISRIWEDESVSYSKKVSMTNDIRRRLDQDVALHLIRLFPVHDPNTGQTVPLDSYLRALVSRQSSQFYNTRFSRDPVGTAFDMLTGTYSPIDFVKENMSLARQVNPQYYGNTAEGGIQTDSFGTVRPDPNNPGFYRDKDDNLHSSSVIEQQQKQYQDMINRGAHKDASGTWVIPESEIRRQAEEEKKKKK